MRGRGGAERFVEGQFLAQGAADDDGSQTLRTDLAHAYGFRRFRDLTQGGQCALQVSGRHGHDHRAFAGDVHGIQPQEFAGTTDFRRQRQLSFLDGNRGAAGFGPFMQDGRQAAARGVAHGADRHVRTAQCRHGIDQWRAVAGRGRVKLQSFSARHDGHSVTADRPAHQDLVSRLERRRSGWARQHDLADACRVDEQLIGRTAWDDFRIARDDRHADPPGGGGHAVDHAPQQGDRQALFDDQCQADPARLVRR